MEDIILKNVSAYYNSYCVLNNINLTVDKNDFLSIIGPNGSGKTTLIKIIMRQIKPEKGEIFINPKKIGYVPQLFSFNRKFPITVYDVVLSGKLKQTIIFFNKYTKEDRLICEKIMKQLDIWSLKDKQISEISGGQLQKVIIARALVSNPELLILDEPTANVDEDTTKEIFDLLKELNKKMTIILVCHNINLVEKISKSIIKVDKGIVQKMTLEKRR